MKMSFNPKAEAFFPHKQSIGIMKRAVPCMVVLFLITGGGFSAACAQQVCQIKFFNFCAFNGCDPDYADYVGTSETSRTLQATYEAAQYRGYQGAYTGEDTYWWSEPQVGGSNRLGQDGTYSFDAPSVWMECDWDVFCDARDTDGDGIPDDADTCPLDPYNDADNDGICGDVDACPLDSQNDADGDGVCGDIDPCPESNPDDADGDNVCDNADNCPGISNPGQADSDNDGVGDACDNNPIECRVDFSTDSASIEGTYFTNELSKTESAAAELVTVLFQEDQCVSYPLPGDVSCLNGCCEDYCGIIKIEACIDGTFSVGPGPSTAEYGIWDVFCDTDQDGLSDEQDNCPQIPNGPEKGSCYNYNTKEVGSACTAETCGPAWYTWCDNLQKDIDKDGIGDVCDNCPDIANASQADQDNDTIGNVCDSEPYFLWPTQVNQGAGGDWILVSGDMTFANDASSEAILWTTVDPDSPDYNLGWPSRRGIVHSYVSYREVGQPDWSAETETVWFSGLAGFASMWNWVYPANHIPASGLYEIKVISEDADGNRCEEVHTIEIVDP